METTEEKSPHLGLGLQSDLASDREDRTVIDDEKLNRMLADELEELVVSVEDEVANRDFPEHAVADEEGELERAVDEELYQLVVTETVRVESSASEGGEEKARALRECVDEALERCGVNMGGVLGDPTECRVLEVKEVDESGSGVEVQVKRVVDDDGEKVFEHKDDADLKEKHEILIEGEHGGIEVLENEYDDERRSNDGDGRGFENEGVNMVEVGGEEGEGEGEGQGEVRSVAGQNDDKLKRYHYPLRPDAEDCSYYMRTGMCKFGSNCKFNHPLRRRNQGVKFVQAPKEIVKHKEENNENSGQIECKFYLSSGGCKYGKACRYNHGKGRTTVFPVAEYNFLGLPIRLGEKECPYYMRNGSCKYGPNCRFNHPDPTAVGGGDTPAAFVDGSVPLQPAAPTSMPSWSTPRTPNDSSPYGSLMYSPTHSMPPPIPDWNGYQAPAAAPTPLYPTSERSLPTPPAFVLNNMPSNASLYPHHQQPLLAPEFPERPGQLECSYFMKTGDCKYRSACKFHHPKNHVPRMVPSVLSDKGLPLRPDQNICTHYSRYGICKYGPACKYDHPVNYSNPTSAGGYGQGGSDEPLIQQHV